MVLSDEMVVEVRLLQLVELEHRNIWHDAPVARCISGVLQALRHAYRILIPRNCPFICKTVELDLVQARSDL